MPRASSRSDIPVHIPYYQGKFRWLTLREHATLGQADIVSILSSRDSFIDFISGYEVRNYFIVGEYAVEDVEDCRDRHMFTILYSDLE